VRTYSVVLLKHDGFLTYLQYRTQVDTVTGLYSVYSASIVSRGKKKSVGICDLGLRLRESS